MMMVDHCFYIDLIGNLHGCSVDDSEDWQVHLLTIGSGWMRNGGKSGKRGFREFHLQSSGSVLTAP